MTSLLSFETHSHPAELAVININNVQMRAAITDLDGCCEPFIRALPQACNAGESLSIVMSAPEQA